MDEDINIIGEEWIILILSKENLCIERFRYGV